ncbi:TniQ family protein [Pseudomonas sp. LFM046]|uniref:TniQ family protein n=1 Tax=Pseudomonas sp. LFM046 TaxID=1608357 RepID=UPI0009E59668|nr:TniQ family protein [Pseudomonas sp. LFM046]
MSEMTYVALPHKNESPISVLMRTAAGNGYLNVHALAVGFDLAVDVKKNGWQLRKSTFIQYVKEHSSERHSSRFESAFFGFIGDSRQPNVQFGKIVIPYRKLSFQLRICPECARNGFFEKSFHLPWLDACPIHGSKYIEACPQCGKPIDWTKLDYCICKCRFDFRAATSTPGDIELSRTFVEHAARGDQLFINRFIKTLKILSNESELFCDQSKCIRVSARIACGDTNELLNHLLARKKLLPSLNPLAYCSPWLCSGDQLLSNVAAGFVRNHTEVYPEECPPECVCHTLRLTLNELCLAYKLSHTRMHEQLGAEKFKLTKNKATKYYSCDSLCKSLNRRLNSILKFNTIIPSSMFRKGEYTNYPNSIKYLGASGEQITLAIKLNLLSCYRFPPDFIRVIPTAELELFAKQYVFHGSLARQLRIKPAALAELFDFANVRPFRTLSSGHGETYRRWGEIYLKSDTKVITDFLLSIRAHDDRQINTSGIRFLSQELNIQGSVIKKLIEGKILEVDLTDANGMKTKINESQLVAALEWRSNHCTLKELSQEFGINCAELSRRFLSCYYVPVIRIMNYVFIHKDDAQRMRDHLYEFFSSLQAAKFLNVTTARIHYYLRTGVLQAVPPSECGGILNFTLIRRNDVEHLANAIT